jgi:hypothetical protein
VSKSVLIATLSACLLVVAVIAVLTVTVISDDGNGGTRVVYLQPTPATGPGPRGPGPGRGTPRLRLGPAPLRACLQKQGLLPRSPGSPPDLQKMQDALKACLGSAPTPQPAPPPGSKGSKAAPVPIG